MKRYVIVGAGFRCYTMFVRNLQEHFRDAVALTGVYDINPGRAAYFQSLVGEEMKVYTDFEAMLDTEKPDGVIVCTVDSEHHSYVIRALDKGYDVVCEKPVTNTFERCLAIREAQRRSGRNVAVTFNCRAMPHFAKLKELISGGLIGKVYAVNYEYCLDRSHGADYFKRWHRKMEFSQGMLLHKSTHHFDIVNWLLEDEPAFVTALGNQMYYADQGKSMGTRCSQCPGRDSCGSAEVQDTKVDGVSINDGMFYAVEGEDGYVRDTCCFLPDADICDNLSVSVQYNRGTILSYTLNLFSMHEGYRLVLTGENGVAVLEDWTDSAEDTYHIRILHRDGQWEDHPVEKASGGHNGGDIRLIARLFGDPQPDPLGQYADSYAGFVSAMIGIAANMSIGEKKTVAVGPLLEQLK